MSYNAQQTYFAELSGDSEVPPVSTQATGNASFQFNQDNTQVSYAIIVNSIDNVTAAHIHQGNEGENGAIVLSLYNGTTQPAGELTGTLTAGNATAANLEGPLAGKQLSDLITVMNQGTAYVNVHSTDFPNGEIRGTIVNANLFGTAAATPPGSTQQLPLEPAG